MWRAVSITEVSTRTADSYRQFIDRQSKIARIACGSNVLQANAAFAPRLSHQRHLRQPIASLAKLSKWLVNKPWRESMKKLARYSARPALAAGLACLFLNPVPASAWGEIKHVLLLSIDGFRAVDLENCIGA